MAAKSGEGCNESLGGIFTMPAAASRDTPSRIGGPWGANGTPFNLTRVIGCVVEPACEVIAPGVIVHHDLNRFIIGEPDGSRSDRVLKVSKALTLAGFDAPVRDNMLEHLAEALG